MALESTQFKYGSFAKVVGATGGIGHVIIIDEQTYKELSDHPCIAGDYKPLVYYMKWDGTKWLPDWHYENCVRSLKDGDDL